MVATEAKGPMTLDEIKAAYPPQLEVSRFLNSKIVEYVDSKGNKKNMTIHFTTEARSTISRNGDGRVVYVVPGSTTWREIVPEIPTEAPPVEGGK